MVAECFTQMVCMEYVYLFLKKTVDRSTDNKYDVETTCIRNRNCEDSENTEEQVFTISSDNEEEHNWNKGSR